MTSLTVDLAHWPYPTWIAHRGGGHMAPENSLPAFEVGRQQGYRMFECDAQVSADGVPFVLHDATLERTTAGQGLAHPLIWAELQALGLPSLQAVCTWCLQLGLAINIELKPAPGQEERTGTQVARQVSDWWQAHARQHAVASAPALLTSFSLPALKAAQQAAPHLPRGWLVHDWPETWAHTLRQLAGVALVAEHRLWTPERLRHVHAQGWRALAYTVNDAARAQALLAWGIDGLITDCIDTLPPLPCTTRSAALNHDG